MERSYCSYSDPPLKEGNQNIIDEGALEELCDFLIAKGVHSLFPCGTTGEGFLLPKETRKQLASLVVEKAKGRASVIVQTGCIDTQSTIELTTHARDIGADGAAVIAPYFYDMRMTASGTIFWLWPDQFQIFPYICIITRQEQIMILRLKERTGQATLEGAYVEMKIGEAFRPGIVLSETYFAYLRVRSVIADAIVKVVDEDFYECVGIADVNDDSDRKRIGDVVRSYGPVLTQWMTGVLVTEHLNLSSLDETLRKRSVTRIKEHFGPAAECGACKIAVLSGPDPGPALRADATEALYTSLCELAEAIKAFGFTHLLLEPLDRGAHKNGLIGPTSEAVALIRRVREFYPYIGLCWDSSHIALCGEDIFQSLIMSKPYIVQIHLANPVLDRRRSDFGDNHIPFGEPGFFTLQKIADLFQKAVEIELFVKQRPCVSVEVRTPRGVDPWEIVVQARHLLEKAWSLFVERGTQL